MLKAPLILFSKSPRRAELLRAMDLDFVVKTMEVDESYPNSLAPVDVAVYIAEKKAKAFEEKLGEQILISADTIVELEGQILGKPSNLEEAKQMITRLSGKTHLVHTGVCLRHLNQLIRFADTSIVHFRPLSQEEIEHYVERYQPLDKAGSYGIQEWIGWVAIKSIEGSYSNIMGLPTEKLYLHLLQLQS